jgi:hypothetical protein
MSDAHSYDWERLQDEEAEKTLDSWESPGTEDPNDTELIAGSAEEAPVDASSPVVDEPVVGISFVRVLS